MAIPAIGQITDPKKTRVALVQGQQIISAPATALSDALGIPAGGTTGQVLTKSSATDYDSGWADIPAQGDFSGPASAGDGNLVVFDGATGKLGKDSGKKPADFATAAQGAKADTAVQSTDVRERLTADRTYYVALTGSDTNNGLTSSTAFQTIKKALDTVADIDLSIYNVAISVAAATYTTGVVLPGPWVGTGTVTIVGDPVTPANVVISAATDCISAPASASGGRLSISGLKLQTTSGHAINVATNALVVLSGKCDFGTCSGAHMLVSNGGQINSLNISHNITGSAVYHMSAVSNFGIISVRGGTMTLTGTPSFSAFAGARNGGQIQCDFNTYSGSSTGKRYDSANGGLINTGGGGATYLPGSVAGTGTNFGASPYGMYI